MICETFKMNKCFIYLLDDDETALILRPDGGHTFTQWERVDALADFVDDGVELPEVLVQLVNEHEAAKAQRANTNSALGAQLDQRKRERSIAIRAMMAELAAFTKQCARNGLI
jgi:hypothetical protein